MGPGKSASLIISRISISTLHGDSVSKITLFKTRFWSGEKREAKKANIKLEVWLIVLYLCKRCNSVNKEALRSSAKQLDAVAFPVCFAEERSVSDCGMEVQSCKPVTLNLFQGL